MLKGEGDGNEVNRLTWTISRQVWGRDKKVRCVWEMGGKAALSVSGSTKEMVIV